MVRLLLALVLFSSVALAQETHIPVPLGFPPAKRLPVSNKPHPDSVKFKAVFHELYKIIKPEKSVREHAEEAWTHMWRMYKARGLDSLKTHDTIIHALDTNMQYDILFNEYRDQFSAKELQSVLDFFKSPTGRHYLEVEPRLFAARNGAIDQYIRSTMNAITMPMLMPKNLPPREPNAQIKRQRTQHETPDTTAH